MSERGERKASKQWLGNSVHVSFYLLGIASSSITALIHGYLVHLLECYGIFSIRNAKQLLNVSNYF